MKQKNSAIARNGTPGLIYLWCSPFLPMGNTFQGVLLMPKAIDDIKAYKYYEVF